MTEELKQDYLRKMYKISGLAMKLYNELKYGFSEPIYQECLAILFSENNIPWEREKELTMMFHGQQLEKTYKADFVCYGNIVLELKAISEIGGEHRSQLFNYLRITGIEAGMLINFGEAKGVHTERYIFDEDEDRYELVYGDGRPKPKFYPGSNIPYDSL